MIYADNQAVIRMITNAKAKSAQYIINEFLCVEGLWSKTHHVRCHMTYAKNRLDYIHHLLLYLDTLDVYKGAHVTLAIQVAFL